MIEIIEFTDPVCTWCWGSEPILRKVETRYPNDVKVSFIMGGLVKDMNDFQDEFNDIGGESDLSKVNEQIASHWIKASERHKMPVETKGFSLFTKEHTSTYPANIAYKAGQFQGEEIANRFLRRLREAAATEAKQVNRLDVLKELASSVGLDEQQWLMDMESGRAEKEFEKDLARCQQFTEDMGADIVFETAGSAVTVKQAPYLVMRGGKIMIVGTVPGDSAINFLKINREVTIQTVFRYANRYPVTIEAISSGRFDVKSMVTHIYDYRDVQQAFEESVNNKRDIIKGVIKISD